MIFLIIKEKLHITFTISCIYFRDILMYLGLTVPCKIVNNELFDSNQVLFLFRFLYLSVFSNLQVI